MPVVVGVQFSPVAKVYYFDPQSQLDLAAKEYVIVDTSKGEEVVQVVLPPHEVTDAEIVGEMKPVLRRASAWDLVQQDRWTHKEAEALVICRKKAQEYGLPMKVVRCEYNYAGGRLMVYFSAESRIDFRSLVRELARIFHTRIEMRQIGARDEAKLLDGVGKCGRQLCCTSWLREFTAISIRMAKSQQLPLNPDEISGVCGRLLCCLSYEDGHYREQTRKMPKVGSEVITPQGAGRVRYIHPLQETVSAWLETGTMAEFRLDELISAKSGGRSCGTCGGCTVTRRAEAGQEEPTSQATQASAGPAETASAEERPARNRRRRRGRGRRGTE